MAKLAAKLRRSGFDKTKVSSGGGCRVRCSQCEALVVNDIACHEIGCPNIRKAVRR